MEEKIIAAPRKPKGFRKAEPMKSFGELPVHSDLVMPPKTEYMPEQFMDNDTITARYHHLTERLGSDCKLSGKSYQELSASLFDLEQLELSVRQSMQVLYERENFGEKNPLPEGTPLPSDSINISTAYSDGLLEIRLPNTFFRTRAESWHLSTIVKANLYQLETDKGISLAGCFSSPVHIIVKRMDTMRKRGYRDNDNLEVTKLINTICSCLDISDAANRVFYTSMFSLTENPKDSGTVFYIFENQHLDKYWKLFSV